MAPKVSIVITSFLERSKPYLDLCIRSINNLDYDKSRLETIIVSPKWYRPEYPGMRTIHPELDDYGNAHAINVGLKATNPESEYLVYANDDIIFTHTSLKALISSASRYENGLFMPISNDQQMRYDAIVGYPHSSIYNAINPGPKKLDDFLPIIGSILNSHSIYPPAVFYYKTLCTYVLIMRRSTYEAVGDFEESLKTGADDIDYCLRVGDKGFVCGLVMDALVWHFGGVSADHTLSKEQRKANAEAFKAKWGFEQPHK